MLDSEGLVTLKYNLFGTENGLVSCFQHYLLVHAILVSFFSSFFNNFTTHTPSTQEFENKSRKFYHSPNGERNPHLKIKI